jgi:hypothetical protein
MHRANAYAALSEELGRWRQRPKAQIVASVGQPAVSREVRIAGEPVTIELSASWANQERNAVRLEAVAYGPSHWRMEQLTEGVTVPLEPE